MVPEELEVESIYIILSAPLMASSIGFATVVAMV
ncbi:hypothetical protein cco75_00595 [Campylobacter coli LMG 9854]|nr:hypothetical protein cco75_00595 [Campylobacter coli LMG 9854]